MLIWIIYDITSDKVRTRVAKLCRREGLRRVQKSVFLGQVKCRKLPNLEKLLMDKLDVQTDRLFIVPTNPKTVNRMPTFGRNPALGLLKRRFLFV